MVSKVIIKTSKESAYGDVSNVEVYISNQLCGKTPSSTAANQSYTVTCTSLLTGTQVKLQTTTAIRLVLAQVEVYSY